MGQKRSLKEQWRSMQGISWCERIWNHKIRSGTMATYIAANRELKVPKPLLGLLTSC